MTAFAEAFTLALSGEDKTNPAQWFWRGSVAMPTELATGPADDPTSSNLLEIGFGSSEAYIITSRQIRAVSPEIRVQALIGDGQGLPVHTIDAQIRQARSPESANRWINQLVSGANLSRFASWAQSVSSETRTYRLAGQVQGDNGQNFFVGEVGIENLYVGAHQVQRAYYGTKQVWGNSVFFQYDAGLTLRARVTPAPPGEVGFDYDITWALTGIYSATSFTLQYQPNSTGAWLPVTPQPSGGAAPFHGTVQTVRFPDANNGIRIRATSKDGAQTSWVEWFPN